ncbi:MAG: DUF1574 domain-containing protein [Candidatus Obscuribacterales bacterium]|nr:DUF1574 domain-containing protein [Candidatus Obscuribacterales bacterium]
MKERLATGLKAFSQSYALWAIAALFVFDFAVRCSIAYWPIDPLNSPNRSWVWWAVQDFRKAGVDPQKRPDIVLMGSSLMMAALHGGDATYLNQPQNVAFHHRARVLEDLLRQRTGLPVNTFAFAIGGQMASDAYALTTTLLRGANQPKAIIYGIAPRDFMDNTLTSPASTETFRYMSRIGGLDEVAWQSRPGFWEQVEFGLAQLSSLYNHRLDFVYLQNKYVKEILEHTTVFKNLDEVHTPFALRKQALLELPEDQGPNDLMILPFKAEEYRFDDNLNEYRMRYRAFKPKLFEMQLSFLERMLKFCKEQGTAVYLVNMPLTQANVDLMPPGFYQNYKQRIGSLAGKYGASVLDMHDPSVFGKELFADSVHMNGAGGVKFFKELSARTPLNSVASGRKVNLQ